MRSSVTALSLAAAIVAGPAFAADMPESYYEQRSEYRAPVETETVVEEPSWRRVEIEEEPEERVIVRRPPPEVVRRAYVEDLPPPRYERHAYTRYEAPYRAYPQRRWSDDDGW